MMEEVYLPEINILKTSRLLLRIWSVQDLESGFTIWGDPEVMKFIDSGQPATLDQVKSTINAGIEHQEKYGYQHWAVIEVDSKKLIGACGFNRTENDGELELVFHFAKGFWGKGYATEAVIACLEFARKKLKPNKIVAGCHHENEASKNVLLKAGLTFVGNRWFEDTQRDEPCFELKL